MGLAGSGSGSGGGYPPWSSAGKAFTNPRPASALLMSSYDTGGSDSQSDLQTAINAAVSLAATVGRAELILDSRQVYTMAAAPSAGPNGQLAQLYLPATGPAAWVEIVGIPGGDVSLGGNTGINQGTVIQSTLASASSPAYSAATGIASMIGGPSSFCTAGRSFTTLKLAMSNVTLRQVANPPLCGLDLGWLNAVRLDTVQADTTEFAAFPGLGSITQPTRAHAIGIQFPFINVGGHVIVRGMAEVMGYNAAFGIGENLMADTLAAWSCNLCLALDVSGHPNRINTLWDINTKWGIAGFDPANPTTATALSATGKGSRITAVLAAMCNINTWDVQDANGTPAWGTRLLDINDTVPAGSVTAWIAKVASGGGFQNGILTPASAVNVQYPFTSIYNRTNQRGRNTPPSVPANSVAIRNPFARDAIVQISGGTTTQIWVAGVQVGTTTPQTVYVPANAQILIVYSVAPSWTWDVM